MQTRRLSLIEAWFSVTLGYVISTLVAWLVFPLFGWETSIKDAAAVSAIYFFLSLFRSYAVRRFFNWLHLRFP
jgi:hypothetical protein